ncbi:MAG: CCA tRNA nucleotidyltransferase [Streptosporangiales bacterium]|nr:CCA tRNA nucleotidyltransferase [Streptosporangiales bacterium]
MSPNSTEESSVHAQRRAVAELLRITPVADELSRLFTAAGHQLALVGGSVRDALRGSLGADLDFTTDARPEEILAVARPWADAVWEVGIAFGTVGLRKGDYKLEVTTYRSEQYDKDSRKPEVQYGDSLVADLARRDFTVNAIAVPLPLRTEQPLLDPHAGLEDLMAGVLRTPGRPEDSFADDPLRMLRAARFASQLGLEVAAPVVEAMTSMRDRLAIVSAERIRDELTKLLLGNEPRRGFTLMVDTGLAEHVLPELPGMQLEIDEHHRHKDVYEHTLKVLEQAMGLEGDDGPDLVLRLAAVMHDVGKPRTRRWEPDGRVSFHHHEVVGARMTKKRLAALRYPKDVVADVTHLVELHLRFHGYAEGEWTDSAVRRYVRDAGHVLARLHKLTRADCTTMNKRKAQRLARAYDHLEERIDRLAEEEELAKIRPDLDGKVVMAELGIPPGPLVGKALQHLLELRMEHGPLGEERAKEELHRWAVQQRDDT